MMTLTESLLTEHYAHLVDKPFFKSLLASMTALPVIVVCLKGKDAVAVVRAMTGATNSRNAAPGTIRGDFGMSGQENMHPTRLKTQKSNFNASSAPMRYLNSLLPT